MSASIKRPPTRDAEDERDREPTIKEIINIKLIESGEKEWLKELLRERLIECGWRDEMKALCRNNAEIIAWCPLYSPYFTTICELQKGWKCFMILVEGNFLGDDIRVKPDLDAVGALGDVGGEIGVHQCSMVVRKRKTKTRWACQLVWEVRVVGWDISYGAEFVPSAEGGYTWIVQKSRKIWPSDEPIICCSFKSGEPGKIVLTLDNQTSKKKKLIYRS